MLLKQFAEKEKVNVYDYGTAAFRVRKLKNTFAQEDIFDSELEQAFATKLEGPFGNLLHHNHFVVCYFCINTTIKMECPSFISASKDMDINNRLSM